MEELKIISKEETNSFCDESKANDGGGYSQPYYEFEYDGWQGNFYNASCGDFGTRLSVSVEKDTQGYRASWGSMDGVAQYSDFHEKFPVGGFYEAFEERFGFGIPTEEDMQTEWDDEQIAQQQGGNMEGKKTELRIKLSTKEKHFHSDKSSLIDYVVEKIKELEESGEYKCTLLEIEI